MVRACGRTERDRGHVYRHMSRPVPPHCHRDTGGHVPICPDTSRLMGCEWDDFASRKLIPSRFFLVAAVPCCMFFDRRSLPHKGGNKVNSERQ